MVLWLEICTPYNPRQTAFGGSESTWYSPQSIIALFPSLFMRRLPNLKQIQLHALLPKYLQWPECEDVRNPAAVKFLPHVPFPQRYPHMLSHFSTVTDLRLHNVSFASFGEFVRIVSVLSRLETLYCVTVYWSVWGVVPSCISNDFLPALTILEVGGLWLGSGRY